MNYETFRPHKALAPYVDYFWVLTDHSSSKGQHSQRVLPDGRSELMVHFGEAFERLNSNKSFEQQSRSLFAGQMTRFIELRPSGVTGIVAARFKPAGAMRFTRVPLFEITNEVPSLEILFGGKVKELEERIFNATSNLQRVQLLQNFLLCSLSTTKDDLLLQEAVRMLHPTYQKSAKIFSVSQAIGLSERQLERRFKEHIGIGPKKLACILRFQCFLLIMKKSPRLDLLQAALAAGYYDQAHFIREFKEFSGDTPTVFFKKSQELIDHFTGSP